MSYYKTNYHGTSESIPSDIIKPDILDKIEEILDIKDPNEMDTRIFKNIINISKIFKTFINKLYNEQTLTNEETEVLVYALKFIDMLNLFMNNQSINSLMKQISDINQLVQSLVSLESRDLILKKIRYTEMTIVYFKKKIFKNLFFGNGIDIGKEIQRYLGTVHQNGIFDQKLFKQMQNIFYVVKSNIEENLRAEICTTLTNMKEESIHYKKMKYSYYEDFNDYSDYKNYTHVNNSNLYDYNDHFYSGYNNYYNDHRYGRVKDYDLAIAGENRNFSDNHYEEEKTKKNATELKENSNNEPLKQESVHIPKQVEQVAHSNPSPSPPQVTQVLKDDIEVITNVIPGNSKSYYKARHTYSYQSDYTQKNYDSKQKEKKNQTSGSTKAMTNMTQVQETCPNSTIEAKRNEVTPVKSQKNKKKIKSGSMTIVKEISSDSNANVRSNKKPHTKSMHVEREVIIETKPETKESHPEPNTNLQMEVINVVVNKNKNPPSTNKPHSNPFKNFNNKVSYSQGYAGNYNYSHYTNYQAQSFYQQQTYPATRGNKKDSVLLPEFKEVTKFVEIPPSSQVAEIKVEEVKVSNELPGNNTQKSTLNPLGTLVNVDIDKMFEFGDIHTKPVKSLKLPEQKEITKPHEESEDSIDESDNDSIDNEEIEEEFNKFIKETNPDPPYTKEELEADHVLEADHENEGYQEDYSDDEAKSKNNKVIFDDNINEEQIISDSDSEEEIEVEQETEIFMEENHLNPPPDVDTKDKEENPSQDEQKIDNTRISGLKESTQVYIDSLKNIDPQILNEIKAKLTAESNKQQDNQLQGNSLQAGQSYVNQFIYQAQMNYLNKLPMQFVFANYANFYYRGKDSAIHREYFELKYLEQQKNHLVINYLDKFEKKILIPIYQKINSLVNKKRGIYYYTYMKYKKLIHSVLNKDKVLKKVKPYGSFMNNFMIDSGDIDICIVPKCGILEFVNCLEKLKDKIIQEKIAEHKLTHHTSRYMLLKVMDNQTKFIIDITVHNMLPVLNTNLIRLYSLYDQRFHILGLYIKHWAKINKVHGAADNFLSSYAMLLMLIHFLQKIVEPRVLPILQKIEDKNVPYEYVQNGETIVANIYYEEDVSKIKNYMKNVNKGKENKDSVVQLLLKFFEYYCYQYDYNVQRITIHRDLNESVKTKQDGFAFSIEDPFDKNHNPGKSMMINSVQFSKFVTSMKKEINLIMSGEYVKRLEKICPNTN